MKGFNRGVTIFHTQKSLILMIDAKCIDNCFFHERGLYLGISEQNPYKAAMQYTIINNHFNTWQIRFK